MRAPFPLRMPVRLVRLDGICLGRWFRVSRAVVDDSVRPSLLNHVKFALAAGFKTKPRERNAATPPWVLWPERKVPQFKAIFGRRNEPE